MTDTPKEQPQELPGTEPPTGPPRPDKDDPERTISTKISGRTLQRVAVICSRCDITPSQAIETAIENYHAQVMAGQRRRSRRR